MGLKLSFNGTTDEGDDALLQLFPKDFGGIEILILISTSILIYGYRILAGECGEYMQHQGKTMFTAMSLDLPVIR